MGIGMPSREKMDLLRNFLGSLPAGLAGHLARAVEADRLNQGSLLPHDLILESLRPALRAGHQASRTQTPMRVFCRPFEDLLVSDRHQKQKGRIARSSITPVWNWLAQDVIPDVLSNYAIAMKTAVLGYRADEMQERTRDFWKSAANAIRSQLNSDSTRRTARQKLESDLAVEDAREMAIMLSAAPEICDLQDALPLQLPSLTDEVIQTFRAAYDKLAETNADAAPYLPLIVMNRLEHPWEALRLPLAVSRTHKETLVANTDMGLVGEVLFSAIEMHAAAILGVKPNQFNSDALLGHVEGFTTLSTGVAKEVELRRDGVWGQRLIKDRAAVAGVMDGFMDRAAREIMGSLPMQKSGTAGAGPKVPDMSRPPDPEKADRALSYARLIAGCRRFAAPGSFAASLKRADEEVTTALRTYNEDIVRELRHASDEKRLNAEQFAAVATELTTILFSPEEGEFLRRRGRAAVSSPIAA
jgi:hypothetical protein